MSLATVPAPAVADRLVVLFDRDCGVCQSTVSQLRRWDRRGALEFLPLQDAATSGRPLLAAVAADLPLLDRLHVVDERTGEVAAGGDAALAIIDRLPGAGAFRPWRDLPTTRAAASLVYELVAAHRDRIGEVLGLDVSCVVPVG